VAEIQTQVPGGDCLLSGAGGLAIFRLIAFDLPDRFLGKRLYHAVQWRREAAGRDDPAAEAVARIADSVKRRNAPGEVDVGQLDADAIAKVGALLQAVADQDRAAGSSTFARTVRLLGQWEAFARDRKS
jgi:hypothetical protein